MTTSSTFSRYSTSDVCFCYWKRHVTGVSWSQKLRCLGLILMIFQGFTLIYLISKTEEIETFLSSTGTGGGGGKGGSWSPIDKKLFTSTMRTNNIMVGGNKNKLSPTKRSSSSSSRQPRFDDHREKEEVGGYFFSKGDNDDINYDDNPAGGDDHYDGDDVVYFDETVSRNIQATYDGARSYLGWPKNDLEGGGDDETPTTTTYLSQHVLDDTFKVQPLMATIDRRPIIVRKQIFEGKDTLQQQKKENNNMNNNEEYYLGCAISSTTFVSDLELQNVFKQGGRHQSSSLSPTQKYNQQCEICFQFTNKEDMLNFGPPTESGDDDDDDDDDDNNTNNVHINIHKSISTKCFQGQSATLIEKNFASWQQQDERFVGYGYPWTIDCQMPSGIKELTCESISTMLSSSSSTTTTTTNGHNNSKIQSIYYQTKFTIEGFFDRRRQKPIPFNIHSRWPWKAVVSHDDDRSSIATRLGMRMGKTTTTTKTKTMESSSTSSLYVPNTPNELNLAHVHGPIYDKNWGNDGLMQQHKYLLLVNLFHLIRNAPGVTHMVAVVDGQAKQTYKNMLKLLNRPVKEIYPKYSDALNQLVMPQGLHEEEEEQQHKLIPVDRMRIMSKDKSTTYYNVTLMEVLRRRRIKIHVVPILTPSLPFAKSVCGLQYQFATFLPARYAADYHAIMYVDSDTAVLESSSSHKTLQRILFDRFFSPTNTTNCAGHRIRLIEQYIGNSKDTKMLQCTANLATNQTKWDYATKNCQLKEGHIVARTDSIYALNVHHPETLTEYAPPGIENCITPRNIRDDRYFLKDSEIVEFHLRDRKRKTGCSCSEEEVSNSISTRSSQQQLEFDEVDFRVGDLVAYEYDEHWGWIIAKIRKIIQQDQEKNWEEDPPKLELKFLTDKEIEEVSYNPNRVKSLDSMNSKQTGALMNCTGIHNGQNKKFRPSDMTATVSCHKRRYIASKDAFQQSGKIIVGVLSGSKNLERRQAIRQTWAKNRTGVFFVVAGPWSDVADEYDMFRDLVWIDEEEAFDLLTLKTALFVQVVHDMASKLNLNYSHVLKTDDDSYVDLDKLGIYTESEQSSSEGNAADYRGYCEQRYWKPIREPDHVYYVSYNEYPKPYYPPYCQGAGFILSRRFVHCAGSQGHIKSARYLSMEDVFVGILAARCGLWPTHDNRFQPYRVHGMKAIESRKITAESNLLPKATMKGKFLQHQIKGLEDMVAHWISTSDKETENAAPLTDDGSEVGDIVAYSYNDEWLLAKVFGVQENGKLQLSAHISAGDTIVYFLGHFYGWLLAKVIDVQPNGKMRLLFLLDNEIETVDYDKKLVKSLEVMTSEETGALKNCTATGITLPMENVGSGTMTTVTISCHTLHYVASKEAFKRSGKIITGVLSGAKNYDRRQLIRATWASNRTGVFFIVAGPWRDVVDEYEKYQDLIWVDKEDAFGLLTYKTSLFLQVVDDMASELNLEYSHVLKTDDDSYVALGRLEDFIHRRHASGADVDYWGQCKPRYLKPIRDPSSVYKVDYKEYPEPYYPPYCQGAAFVLSQKFVHCAGSEGHIRDVRYLSMEDVFVGILAARCGVRPTHDTNNLVKVYRVEGSTVFSRRKPSGSWLPDATMDGKIVQHQVNNDKDMWDHHESFERRMNGQTKKARLEFVHATKTGGSAIEKAAAIHGIMWGACHYLELPEVGCAEPDIPYSDPGFQSYELSSPWHTPPKSLVGYSPYYGADLFTVVRNPYSRAVSEYYCPWLGFNAKYSKVRQEGDRNDPNVMNAWIKNMIASLESNIEKFKNRRIVATPVDPDPKPLAQKHYINQVHYVYDFGGEKMIKNILYYENLQDEFDDLMEKYDLNIRLPDKSQNGTNIAENNKLSFLDLRPDTIQMINSYAAADFHAFGYEMVEKFETGVPHSLMPKEGRVTKEIIELN